MLSFYNGRAGGNPPWRIMKTVKEKEDITSWHSQVGINNKEGLEYLGFAGMLLRQA